MIYDRLSDMYPTDRHELEPVPVLPLDTTDGTHLIQLRDPGTGNNRCGGLRDRCTSRQTRERSSSPKTRGYRRLANWRHLQGKWNFRAKRKGDLLAEY